MTTAREKAIERLALMLQMPGRIDSAEQADRLFASTAHLLTPEGGDVEGLARARWEERKADAAHVLDALSLAAIDPALVEALRAARPNDQVCIECGATLPTDRGVSRLSCRRLDMSHVWQRTTERAEQAVLHAVLAQLRGSR
jgi:ribosomal protein L40E